MQGKFEESKVLIIAQIIIYSLILFGFLYVFIPIGLQ